jgi:hypothetical protein
MQLSAPIAAALLAIATAGCVRHAQPQAAVPAVPVAVPVAVPPEPLSAPQTRVQLPPPQALNPEALVLAPAPQTPPPAAPPAQPAAPAVRRAPAPPPKPDPPPAAPEPARPSIREVLPEAQRSQLQVDAANSRQRIRAWLDSTRSEPIAGQAKLTRDRIQSFLKASSDAERRGDLREAVQLAERAEILIREMQGGR